MNRLRLQLSSSYPVKIWGHWFDVYNHTIEVTPPNQPSSIFCLLKYLKRRLYPHLQNWCNPWQWFNPLSSIHQQSHEFPVKIHTPSTELLQQTPTYPHYLASPKLKVNSNYHSVKLCGLFGWLSSYWRRRCLSALIFIVSISQRHRPRWLPLEVSHHQPQYHWCCNWTI